jgi:hypothetical protein
MNSQFILDESDTEYILPHIFDFNDTQKQQYKEFNNQIVNYIKQTYPVVLIKIIEFFRSIDWNVVKDASPDCSFDFGPIQELHFRVHAPFLQKNKVEIVTSIQPNVEAQKLDCVCHLSYKILFVLFNKTHFVENVKKDLYYITPMIWGAVLTAYVGMDVSEIKSLNRLMELYFGIAWVGFLKLFFNKHYVIQKHSNNKHYAVEKPNV